jgi:hypothetical protein
MDRVALLAARYPVVRRLAGDESFMEAATGFVFGLPRRKPGNFGDTFPQFLRSLGPSASIEYLADIAEFETALSKARNKAAQRSKRRLPSRSNHNAGPARMTLHPSVSVVESRFPVVTIWEANHEASEGAMIYRWNAEAALVAAPRGMVEIRRLPAGGAAFFRTLLSSGTISDAAAAGRFDAPDFDLAANLSILSNSRVAADVMSPTAA